MLGRKFKYWSRFFAVLLAILIGTPYWMFPFHFFDSLAASAESGIAIAPFGRSVRAPDKGNSTSWPGLRLAPHSFSTMATSPPPAYDHCVQDDTDHNKLLRFSSTTGAFMYSQDGQILFTGTGTPSTVNGCVDFSGKSGNNSVKCTYAGNCTSATATITWNYAQGLYSTFTLTDSNTADDTCGASPTVTVLAPVGGEILDTGSIFNIVWNSSDSDAIVSQDILLSTDGGSTFSNVVVGLSPTVQSYAWTVPTIANNAKALIEVVAHNAEGNQSAAESGLTSMIWNPGASLPNVAEAPLFFSGQGFTSTIYLTNTSYSTVTVELDPHFPSGNATQNFPTQLSLAPEASATVDTASLYTIGPSPDNPNFPDAISGGIRLRHNGATPTAVVASIIGDMGGTQKYSTPFTYPAVSQSSSATMQCAPMYYVDSASDALVSLQNATNSPQTVEMSCNYGAGSYGSNGQANSSITLGPQQTYVAHMSAIMSEFDGASWGSVDIVTTSPQSVVAHSVMVSAVNGTAWDCPFLDPSMSVGTTKVANSVMLDYDNQENGQIMVCNMSSSSRTVTVSFPTGNGVSIPSTQVTLDPESQQMITLNSQTLLSSGQTTLASAVATYSGNASDVALGGCSMSGDGSRALPIKFVEPAALNQRMLTSPYVRFDQNYSGQLQVLNLGTTSIQAGAKVTFANSTVAPVRTPLTTIAPGAAATIDLSNAADAVPDSVGSVAGRVDLIQSGPAGSVAAAVTTLGMTDNSGQVITPTPEPIPPLTLFPESVVINPGGCTTIDAVTDGTLVNPCAPGADGCLGTAIETFAPVGGSVFTTTLCVPISCSIPSPNQVMISWTCGTPPPNTPPPPPDTTAIPVVIDATGATTSTGRLDPNGGITPFSITLKKAAVFPTANYQVSFVQAGGASVSTQVAGNGTNTISGTAPTNHTYLGAIKTISVQQLDSSGNPSGAPRQIHNTGLYYALPAPGSVTGFSGNPVPATGGPGTITGNGFQTWMIGTNLVNPTVVIGTATKANPTDQIRFTINGQITGTAIPGLVGPTPANVTICTCLGQTPCKEISVINPGGSFPTGDATTSNGPLISTAAPPAPTINGVTSSQGNSSNTLGIVTPVAVSNGISMPRSITATINGNNLSRVQTVTFAQVPAQFKILSKTQISVQVPPICATGPTTSAAISVSDNCNPPATIQGGWFYVASEPIQFYTSSSRMGAPGTATFLVGQCEQVAITETLAQNQQANNFTLTSNTCTYSGPASVSCVQAIIPAPTVVVGQVAGIGVANLTTVKWSGSCGFCDAKGSFTGYFNLMAKNSTNPSAPTLTICESTGCSH